MNPGRRPVALGLGIALLVQVVASASALAAAAPRSPAGLLPIAVNDSGSVIHGRLRSVAAPGVLGNDLQLGGGFTTQLVSGVSNGTLDLNPNGSYTYQSNLAFVGTDQFRYKVNGGLLGLSNVATVTLTVTNRVAVASGDGYSAVANAERSIGAPGVLANDDDGDGDSLTIEIVTNPANGSLNAAANGSFRYTANAGFAGTDTFRYRAWDGAAWSNTATVSMSVTVPATPTPTPTPTAAPTPTPTPNLTAAPTPTPTASPTPPPGSTPKPTPRPTPTPTSGATPMPSPGSAATPRPSGAPSPSPTPDPGTTPGPTGSPATTATPTPLPGQTGSTLSAPPSTDPTTGPTATPGPTGEPSSGAPPAGAGGGPTDPDPSRPDDRFSVPGGGSGGDVVIDASYVAFGAFEWAVPALLLTVPGLLLILAILAQASIGLAFLPVARRWLGGDRRRRQPA